MEAIETGWPVERLVWCPDLLTSEPARRAIEEADADKVKARVEEIAEQYEKPLYIASGRNDLIPLQWVDPTCSHFPTTPSTGLLADA